MTEAHLDNERDLLRALSDDEQRRLADLLRKLQLGLPARERAPAPTMLRAGRARREPVWQ